MAISSATLTMAEQLVPDEVWLPFSRCCQPSPPHPKGGRPWIEDRAVLGGSSVCCGLECPGGCSRPESWHVAAA
jgi:hypothetical protein